MCPTFGAEPRFGTHPMAWAAPGGKNEADFLFDVATTQVNNCHWTLLFYVWFMSFGQSVEWQILGWMFVLIFSADVKIRSESM